MLPTPTPNEAPVPLTWLLPFQIVDTYDSATVT